jgi:creatinine amidohydrolase/Fe(II)-dependent formamide hydrolase-like protein
MRRIAAACFAVLTTASLAFAQTSAGQPPDARGQGRPQLSPEARAAAQAEETKRMFAMERPIDAVDTVWIEEMTWLEVRDAMKAGKKTVIVPTGGVEQNGPYLATGKHNYVNRATCEAIARKLGNALCAPNVPFVPEGGIEPKTSHMVYPGTISLTEETFQALLTDIASSLKAHGFEHVILIGDSGGNQAGMKTVAANLTSKWGAGSKTTIHFIPEYYQYPEAYKWAAANLGWKEVPEGHHDDPTISTIMMTVDPNAVRIKQRIAKKKASINGIPLAPVEQAVAWGRKLVDYRAQVTVDAIKKAIANPTHD